MLVTAVFGILTTVKLRGFVALDIVKLNAPSAFVAFFVILIVDSSGGGGGITNVSTKIHSAVSPDVTLMFSVVFCGTPFIRQLDASSVQPDGTVSVTL